MHGSVSNNERVIVQRIGKAVSMVYKIVCKLLDIIELMFESESFLT